MRSNCRLLRQKKRRPSTSTRSTKEVESVVGTSDFAINDIAPRPNTDEVYLAVSVGSNRTPKILVVHPTGPVKVVDVSSAPTTVETLEKPPAGDQRFLNAIPARSFTVTDMKFHDGKLYVAGLSNLNFASSMRVLPYPFVSGKQALATIEIYHTSHDQIETRAPIRAMGFADIGGTPSLIAAYTCTPLVTIPLAQIADGAHIRGKSVGELGYGNTPDDMVIYTASTLGGPVQPYVLVSNMQRNVTLIPMSSVAAANAGAGIAKPVEFGKNGGVDVLQMPMDQIARIDDEGGNYLIALRRNLDTGSAELVTYDKRMNFRVSDFPVSEYTFADYNYAANGPFQLQAIKPGQDLLKGEEGYPTPLKR